MENNKIIIILLIVIIAILAAGIGLLLSGDLFKQECKININCNESITSGEEIAIKLVDANKTGISNANIDISIIDGNKTIKKYTATTNEKGKASIQLSDIDNGKYKINCTYNGNSKYKHTSSKKTFNYTNKVTESSSSTNPIDANRPVNNPNYKGYTPNHESEITSDGWNPREHEVSRQKNPDGTIRIRYDDGYFRIVDQNGYVITYGYG